MTAGKRSSDMLNKYILRRSLLPLVLFLTVTMAAAADAKEGFYLGAGMVFNDIGGNINSEKTIASGNGFGVKGGYGVSRYIALETSFSVTDHVVSTARSIELEAAVISVKASLPTAESPIEPYLVLGIGKYMLDSKRGAGWQYGAGMDINISPAFILNVGIARSVMDIGSAPRESGEVTSMDIGIIYRFI
jgi:hypothetical protein